MSQDRPASVNLAFHGRGSVPPISKAARKPTFLLVVLGVPAVENLAWRCNLQRDSLVLIADRLSGALRSKEEASSEPGGWR